MVTDNWKEMSLGEMFTLQRGFDLPSRLRKQGNVPIVSSAGPYDFHDRYQVEAPGVVTGRYGTIGEVFYIEENFWPLNTTLFVKDFKGNNPHYISYLLRTVDFASHSGKSGVPGINRNDIHELRVSKPPLEEQIAIANVLSDVDVLITSLEKLIDKKLAIKTAAMQLLLTGKKRLPPFDQSHTGYKQTELGEIPGDWQIEPLNRLVISHNSGIYVKKELYGRGNNIAGVGDMYDISKVDGQEFSKAPLTPEDQKKYTLKEGDLIYGESSLVREGIARTVYVTEKGAGTAFAWHTRRYSVTTAKVSPNYLYYYLASKVARDHMITNSIQTALTGINTVAYFACPVILPPLPEQIAIAATLSDMESDIEGIQDRLIKTQNLKKGMMQELLTGRTRLV